MREEILSLVNGFQNKLILVVGDTIVDKTTYTKAVGLSLESPTLKTEFTRETVTCGGAANVVRSLSELGINVAFITYGQNLTSKNHFKSNVQVAVPCDLGYDGNIKHRFVVEHNGVSYKHLQINHVNHQKLTEQQSFTYCDEVQALIDVYGKNAISAIAISDYHCGLLSSTFQKFLLKTAKENKIPLYVASQMSSKPSNFFDYCGADYFVMNHNEYWTTFDADRTQKVNPVKDLRCKGICVTNGSKGASFETKSYRNFSYALENVNVKNVIGAGDAFYAAFVAGHDDPIRALDLANAWAGLTIQKELGELPCLEDLKKL
jgi:bifunctional ADP-heptose synthase (sugar kinase/adenylyltransferase)